MNFYYVGGYVRDKILGVENKDIDFAVEAESYEQMRDYIAANGTIFLEKPEFFTIRAMMTLDGQRRPADFVLCRKEGAYLDGRHPSKVEVGTIYDDLARRDFTMNAIAIKVGTEEIIDPFHGVADIKSGLIRCVGDTEERLKEDPLRALRALRFAITKKMTFDDELYQFLDEYFIDLNFAGVSVGRKYEELFKMFYFDTIGTIRMLNDFPYILEACFKDVIWLIPTTKER